MEIKLHSRTWVFSIPAYFNSLKKSQTFHWLNSRRHGAICVDDHHHWNELHCCNRHVDPHRDNLLKTGTKLPSSWASFNQISSPADGGWSLRAVRNSGRPPYLWASGVQIAITNRSDKTLSILSDVQLGRWLKKWQILFLLMTTVVADSHLIN